MEQQTINYFEPDSNNRCRSVKVRSEELTGVSEDALFEEFYKRNNSLRYCNGSYWKFDNPEVEQHFLLWKKSLSKQRSMNLYYGKNGIVD